MYLPTPPPMQIPFQKNREYVTDYQEKSWIVRKVFESIRRWATSVDAPRAHPIQLSIQQKIDARTIPVVEVKESCRSFTGNGQEG